MFRAQQPSTQLPQTDNTGMTEREGVNDSGSGTRYDDLSSSHLSLNREGRWGTTDDFATSFLHFPCSPLPSGTWRTPGLSIP